MNLHVQYCSTELFVLPKATCQASLTPLYIWENFSRCLLFTTFHSLARNTHRHEFVIFLGGRLTQK